MTDLDRTDLPRDRAAAAGLVVGPGEGSGTWHLDALWNWKIPAAVATLILPGAGEEFFHLTGHPATSMTLPPPEPPDLEALMAGMARFGIELVGPPPVL